MMPLTDAYEMLEPPYEHGELMRCSLWLALTNPHNYGAGARAVEYIKEGVGLDTPLHCYMQRRYEKRWERPSLTGLRLLLDHGADESLTNNASQTPADIARGRPCNTPDSQQHQRAILSELGEPAPA